MRNTASPLLLIKNRHWSQRNLGMGCISILSLPPPSYLNLLLMVQSTLFWVMAFCCNLKTHTSRKLNPEGKSTVIRGLIFWYFPYVARIYIKIKCHRWFHKEFRRPFKQTHPSNTEEKHSARNQLNSNLREVIAQRGQKSILNPHNTVVFTSITANNILSYVKNSEVYDMKTHPCSWTIPPTLCNS